MKTVFVGGGRGCQAVLEMVVQNRLAVLSPQVIGVVDLNPDAPGMVFARKQGWPTFTKIEAALDQHNLELVVEVTGIDSVLEEVTRLVGNRARVMDHQLARVFWDLDDMAQNLRRELQKKTELEVELREDRRGLQELLDSLPDSVMVLDEAGRVERVNRQFENITGLKSAGVMGQKCLDLCQAKGTCHAEGDICPSERVYETGRPITVVQRSSCIIGSDPEKECYYQTIATPIRSKDGDLNVVITSREVTEQIRLARETEELARRANQILNTVHGIITITDLEGRLIFMNPSAETFFGTTAEQAEGKKIENLLPEAGARIVRQNDEEIVREGGHLSHEEVLMVDGKEQILITERILLYDYKNDPINICRVARNVTEPRRLQRELLESEKHAAVGKLAAGVAHELNNPLTGVLTFAEDLLEDLPETAESRDDIKVIMREALRCRQIVRDLLDFSRQGKTNRKVTPIKSVIQRTIKLVEKQAAFHNIQFEVDLGEQPPLIYADQNQLQQVLLNLIINARDAMEGKGIITVSARQPSNEGGIHIDIVDRGCGIDTENMRHIFEPFFTTKGDRGNGLGLAAVRSIVQEHGGSVTVDSKPGQGSRFSIHLPPANWAQKTGEGRTHSTLPAYHDWSNN
ncbi:MAG: PAS domain-containing protein [Acidobacteriota bacterium]